MTNVFEVVLVRSNLGSLTSGASTVQSKKWVGDIESIKKRASDLLTQASPNPKKHRWQKLLNGDWIRFAHDYDTENQACYSVVVSTIQEQT